MLRNVTIACGPGGNQVALEYAKIITSQGFPLLVNFPNMGGYAHAKDAEHLVHDQTGALIFIISADLFPRAGSPLPRGRSDASTLRRVLSRQAANAGFKLFLVVIDDETEGLAKASWINRRQWLRDNPRSREEILAALREPFDTKAIETEMSSFRNVESIIAALEPSSAVERIADVRVPAENISYEIFICRHRVRLDGEVTYYVHLHRGITQSNTAPHLALHHPTVATAQNKIIVLSVERGHVRPELRLANVKTAFHCKSVEYLETLVSRLIASAAGGAKVIGARAAPRTFVEPQVRLARDQPPSEYSVVTDWLASPQSGALVLVGQGGIGKTWAMLNLRERITSGRIDFSRQIDRQIVFITSTDVTGGLGRPTFERQGITLYDLYAASHAANAVDGGAPLLPRETFYNALELGSLIVFVDGLDEVVARYRSRFDPIHFFDDLSARLGEESDGNVVISCRTLFFDQEDFRMAPGIQVFDLLAFDSQRRDTFFTDAFQDLPRKRGKAIQLSESLAALPDGRYVPFVLDLIKDVIRKEADGETDDAIEPFQSAMLNPKDINDRIVGQFCRRETGKTPDPIRALSVDEQVVIFSRLARQVEAVRGGLHRDGLEAILAQCLNKKEVGAYVEQFLTHPFISQNTYQDHQLVDFRFDFMPEYFLMLDAVSRLRAAAPLESDDIRVFNKFCALNTPFCRGLNQRLELDDSEFYFRLMQMNEQAGALIAAECPPEDGEILNPDSAVAKFSYAIVSLIAAHETRNQPLQREAFTDGLNQVFGTGKLLRGVVLLDGFVKDEERVRIDFRGLRVEDSLFRAVDIWNCTYDDESVFSRCRFINCSGSFASSSGMEYATFDPTCQPDAVFEHIYARGRQRVSNTQEQNFDSIKSFVEDFYKQAHFIPKNADNLKRYYGMSNSVVPFKRIYRLMLRHGVVEERDRGHYSELLIARSATAAAEQLITQNRLSGPLEKVAHDLKETTS